MTYIPAFGKSLLENPPISEPPAPSVEEVLNATPIPQQAPDTFEHAGIPANRPKQHGGWFLPAFTSIVAATGLFVAGRNGWLGKTVRKWFGGSPSFEKAQEKIAAQLKEYMSKFGEVKSSAAAKADDGSPVINLEMLDGRTKQFSVKDGKTNIKVDHQYQDGVEETILFGREDVAPKMKVLYERGADGKVQGYEAHKGGDILNKDYDDAAGIFKEVEKTSKRRFFFGLIGPRKNITKINTYTNTETGEPVTTKIEHFFNGNKKVKQKVTTDNLKKTFYYDEAGNVTRVKVKPKDEDSYYLHFKYGINADGKVVLTDKIKTSDKAGNNIIS